MIIRLLFIMTLLSSTPSIAEDFELSSVTSTLLRHLSDERKGKMSDFPPIHGVNAESVKAMAAAGFGDVSKPDRLLLVVDDKRVCDLRLVHIRSDQLALADIAVLFPVLRSIDYRVCSGLALRGSDGILNLFLSTGNGINGPTGHWVAADGVRHIDFHDPKGFSEEIVTSILNLSPSPTQILAMLDGRVAYVTPTGAVRVFMLRPGGPIVDRFLCEGAESHALYAPQHHLTEPDVDTRKGGRRDVGIHIVLNPRNPDLFAYVTCAEEH